MDSISIAASDQDQYEEIGDEENEDEDENSEDDMDSDDDPLPGEEDSDSEQELQAGDSDIETSEAEGMNSIDEEEQGAKFEDVDKKLDTSQRSIKSKIKNDGEYFDAAPEGTKFSSDSFASLNLSRPLVRACAALGYNKPTPIQSACIPLALTGRDICGSAITGSGKTAAFSLPILERLLHRNRRVAAIYVLILCPTRELAVQVHSMIKKLGQFTDIRTSLVVGGLSLQAQSAALRSYPEIVVATPGRLIDHLRNSQGFGIEDLSALVFDEADRLLEMGFAEEVREIVRLAPRKRQTMLFSATMTSAVNDLISLSLRHPVRLAADANLASPKKLVQEVIRLRGAAATTKEATLLALASRTLGSEGKTIIFFSTKQQAHRAKILFGLANLPSAAELHGDMSQTARLESLEKFRLGQVSFLLATDVAARGLDILGVQTVVNFDCPRTLETYLHRIGRTARAGASGQSITFAENSDKSILKDLIKKAGINLQQRKLPQSSVLYWQNKIEEMRDDIRRIFNEEAEERILRKAEMEAAKAANMIEHSAEIYSRPARTWFMTNKQKQENATNLKAALNGTLARENEEQIQKKIDKNAAKSARRLERKLNAAKEAEKEASRKKKNKLMEETKNLNGRIKAAKSRAANLREEGVPATKAGRIAALMVSSITKKKKKTQKVKATLDETTVFGNGELKSPRSSTSEGKSAKVYLGGAKSGKPRLPTTGGALSGAALSRVKRGGKGKNSFKSKSRHKRRR